MNRELKDVLREAMHRYALEHGLVADMYDMSPEVRGRSRVLRWEIVGKQLRYEFLDPAAPRT